MTEKIPFDEAYIPEPNSGCWLWLLYLDHGYGSTNQDGKIIPAHRYSWILHNGPIPAGLWVLHRCDVRCCVNPDHLFLGTRQDNIDDMMRKGRHVPASGVRNSHAILNEKQVTEIRSDPRDWNVVAAEYGIKKRTVWDIRARRIWRHVA